MTPLQPPTLLRERMMARKLTIVAFLAALALPVAHAETPAPVLQSLPAELQQNIEQVRTACREALNGAREALLALGAEASVRAECPSAL